jgi:hypothetical protein
VVGLSTNANLGTLREIAGALSRLVVTQQPSSTAIAGTAFTVQPKVAAADSYGNTVASYATPITAAQTSGGNLNATPTAQTVTPSNGVASFSVLYATNAGALTITFTGSGVSSATSATINVSAAPATRLAITTAPITATAGTASGTITVQRLDPFGNPNTTDAARVVILSSTSSGTVTFNPASLSIATGTSTANFTYTDTQAGKPTVTAASTSPITIISGSQQETINAAAASNLSFVQAPPGAMGVGQTFAAGVSVSDAYGNPISGASVSMGLNGGGTLNGGAAQVTGSNGILTFSSLSVNQPGSGKSLTAIVSSPALSATSTPFDVRGPNSLATIGTQSDSSGAVKLTQVATVAPGNTIFVTVAMNPTASTVTVTDSANNTYTRNADSTNSAHAGIRTLVFSAPVTNALSGGTITVSFPSPTPTQKAASFFYVGNLVSPTPMDRTAQATGTSALPNSGSTAMTSMPDELLIGAIGIDDQNQTITAVGGFTNLNTSATAGGSQGVLIQPAYRIVNGMGQYAAAGSANTNRNLDWAAAIVTYKMQVPTVTSVALANPGTNRLAGVTFTVSFSENVSNVDASDFALAVSGLSGASITSVTGSGANYSVTVTTGSGSGTLGLNLVDNDSVLDADNVPLGGTGAGNGNFTGSVYTIDKTTATVAGMASATYGDSSVILSATVTAAISPNPTNGNVTFYVDGISVGTSSLNGSGTATLNYNPQLLSAGNHLIRADFAGDGFLSTSSSEPNNDGSLLVNPKALIVTAASGSKTYGQTVGFAGTGFTTTGLVNSDAVTGVNLASGGLAAAAPVNASPYAVVPTAAVGTGLSNYAITYVNGSLTVNPLPVALTGNRTYDATTTVSAGILAIGNRMGADDVWAASGSGIVAGANVGTQAIISSGTLALGGTAAGNYTLAGATGSVTINPATLTYTATSATRPFGSANSAFSGTVAGFVGIDTQSNATTGTMTFTSPATSTSSPGSYPVNGAGLVAISGNYVFVQAPGNATALTVTQAVAAQPARITGLQVGQNAVALTFTGSTGVVYQIQRTAALQSSGAAWTNIGSATTDSAGNGQFIDPNPPRVQGYYRTVSP